MHISNLINPQKPINQNWTDIQPYHPDNSSIYDWKSGCFSFQIWHIDYTILSVIWSIDRIINPFMDLNNDNVS